MCEKRIYIVIIYYYSNTNRKGIYLTDRGNHRNRFLLSLTEISFYIYYLLYYVYIIILYYYQGRAECRFKDFAHCSFLMRVSLRI